MAKILVVEDEKALAETVVHVLRDEHHVVELALSGDDALDMLRVNHYDLILLDLNLPDTDGLAICKSIRLRKKPVSIIMVTGRTTIDEKEIGLDMGADDYLTKPFHMKELLARVRAILRRTPEETASVLTVRDITLDPIQHRVTKGDRVVKLLPTEFSMLQFFMSNPNRIFSNDQIIRQIWPEDTDVTDNAVTTCITRMRNKIDDTDKSKSLIESIYGEGYRLNA
ncbi:MAG TPA: response regulator transcription factor [Chroococcales cyanobacterium]